MKRELLVFAFFLSGCSATVSNTPQIKHAEMVKAVKSEEKEQSLYEKEVQEKVRSLLKQEPTPLKVPDKVVRVFVLPYVDEKGNLVSQKYVFFKAEEGKWILGDYLLKKGEPLKELKPLEGSK